MTAQVERRPAGHLYVDRCPVGCDVVNFPRVTAWVSWGVRADYVCGGCGHAWFTGWAPKDEGTDPVTACNDTEVFL
jgi:hypothetical protein